MFVYQLLLFTGVLTTLVMSMAAYRPVPKDRPITGC